MKNTNTSMATQKAATPFTKQLLAGIILINLGMYTVIGISLYHALRQYQFNSTATTQDIAHMVDNNITGIIYKAGEAVQNIVDDADEHLSKEGGFSIESTDAVIKRESAKCPEIQGFLVCNSRGEIINSKSKTGGELENISSLEYFKLLRDNPTDKLFISKLLLNSATKQRELNIIRRINNPDGSFAGLSIASLSIDFLNALLVGVEIGANGTIALRDSDLVEIVCCPPSQGGESRFDKKSTMKEFVEFVRSGKASATVLTCAGEDTVCRDYTFRKLSGLPLYITIGSSPDDYLSHWRKEALTLILIMLVFSIVTIAFSRLFKKIWRKEQLVTQELSTLNQDLEWRILERTAALNDSNEMIQVELTERRQAEAALKESEKKYRRIVETATEGICSVDREGWVTFVNQRMASVLGYTIDELLGIKFESLLPEDQLDDHFTQIKLHKLGKECVYERCFKRKNGEKHWMLVSASPVLDSDGSFAGSFGMLTDINERKQTEEALRQSEEQHRLLIETAQEAIVVIQDSKICYLNPMMEEISGYSSEELLGVDFIEFIDPNDRPVVITNHQNRLAGENSAQRYQFRIVRKDAAIRWVELSGVMLDWKGQPATLNFLNDITEQKLSEIELLKLNEELIFSKNIIEENLFQKNIMVNELTETKGKLEMLNSEKDKFFSIIAHDLKSPFLGFLGLTQIMADDAESLSAEELTSIGRNMNRTANNLFSLLQNLLTWAQMQKGALSLVPIDISIDLLIAENVDIMRKRSEQKGITIINKSLEPIQVHGDEKMITSVVLNLLSNSVKFTTRGGTITIETKTIGDNKVQVSVSDTGVGMVQREVEKLFKIGEIIGSTGTDGELSTGLGLLLCKEFVEKNGGEIWAESQVDKGSAFTFTLKMIS